ncbi:hypothetical protein [Photobacterium nomapromontoriensis]|uniref:hypothetical protein n=1 Tax=Photobacterium nomapromontoriensis TaxID=2910237 RepID=UPI003D136A3C
MKINKIKFFDGVERRFTARDCIEVECLDFDGVIADGGYLIPALTDIHTHSDFYFDSAKANQFAKGMGVASQIGGLCGFHAVFDESRVSREEFEEYAAFLGTKGSIFTSFDELFAAAECADKQHLQLLGLNAYLFSYPVTEQTDLDLYVDELAKIFHSYPFVGISVGLAYHPIKTLPETLFQLLLTKLVAKIPTVYNYHIRNQNSQVFESLEEVFVCHRGSSAHCHISHLKFAGATHIGHVKDRFAHFNAMVEQQDFPVTWDVYPFNFACTTISAFLPESDSWSRMTEAEVIEYLEQNPPYDFNNVIIACDMPAYNGLKLYEIAASKGLSVEQAYYKIVYELEGIGAYFRQFCSDADLAELVFAQEAIIASDSLGVDNVHPRCTHTFIKALACAHQLGETFFIDMVCKLVEGPNRVFPQVKDPTEYLYIAFDSDVTVDLSSPESLIDKKIKQCLLVRLKSKTTA